MNKQLHRYSPVCYGNRQSNGFTLLEALLAALVTTLVLSGVYATFSAAQRSVNETQSASDLYQLGRSLLADFDGELANCYPFVDLREKTNEPKPFFQFEDASESATGLDSDSIAFVTVSTRYRNDERPSSDLVKVRYGVNRSLRESEIGLLKYIDLYPGLGRETSGQPQPVMAVEQVRSLNFRFWDAAAGEWIDLWDNEDSLPPAVEVTIGLVRDSRVPPGSEKRESMLFLTTAVDVPLHATPVKDLHASDREESAATQSGSQKGAGGREPTP